MGGTKRRTPKTPKQRNQLASTVSSRDNSPSPNTNSPFDPNAPVTYAGLDAQLQSHLQKTIDALNAQLDEISLVANNALAKAEKLEAKVIALEAENELLKANNTNIIALEERVEERTNRQLRKTLVFRGVPEEKPIASPSAGPNQKKAEETWAETTAKLATLINQTCEEVSLDEATYMIERAHRSAPNPRYKGKKTQSTLLIASTPRASRTKLSRSQRTINMVR